MTTVIPNDLDINEMIESMKALLKTSARMYMHLAQTVIDKLGREGEMTIRCGLRNYGKWRGLEMRQAHHALGLEINMKNLIGCWDNASTYLVKEKMEADGTHLPYDTRFDVHYCPAAEAWKEAEFFRWGHMYCDEFHQACASTYHPDGNVVIPQNLMKGDDHCHFQWIMPPNAEQLELGAPTDLGVRLARDYVAHSDSEAAWRSLRRSNRLVGGRFHAHVVAIMQRHPETGRAMIMEALTSWGAERGRLLRKSHEAAGIQCDLRNLFRHHDMPVRFVWDHRIEIDGKGGCIDITDTPHEEAWSDLSALELGSMWYEGAYPALVKAYLPESKAVWSALRARGDDTNRLKVSW